MVHTFSPPYGRSKRIGTAVRSLTLAALLALGGCASVPPPDGAMNQAQSQLQAARDAGAADYAPVDLGFAQNKFQQAQAAMASRDYDDAASLADEARADAELARAKARLGSARAQIQSKSSENGRLRQRLEQIGAEADAAAAAAAQSQSQLQQAPAGSGSSLPPPQVEDMPAPSSSVLSAPLPSSQPTQDGGGFQPAPADSSQGNRP